MMYSDHLPAERLAYRLGLTYPSAGVDLVMGALDRVLDSEAALEVSTERHTALPPPVRRDRQWRAGKLVLGQLMYVATGEENTPRSRRVAAVGAAGLRYLPDGSGGSHDGLMRLSRTPPFAPDLTTFLGWVGSGDPLPGFDRQFAEAMATAMDAESGWSVRWPKPKTHQETTLRLLLGAKEGGYVSSHDLPGEKKTSTIAKLREIGWGIESAPRGSDDQGYRLEERHESDRAKFLAERG